FEIVIPTYQRRDILIQTILEIKNVNPSINIIISDNNSTDGTYEAVKELTIKYPNIKIYKNEIKGEDIINFAANVYNAITKTTKRYIHLISDTDPSIVKNLLSALLYMKENHITGLYPVKFRSKHYSFNEKLRFGAVKERGASYHLLATAGSYRSVFEWSGILYDGELIRQYLAVLQKYIKGRGAVYFFVLPSFISQIFCKSEFYPYVLSYGKNDNTERHIDKITNGESVYWPADRWYQFKNMLFFLEDMKIYTKDNIQADKNLTQIITEVTKAIIPICSSAAGSQFPRYRNNFLVVRKEFFDKVSQRLNK
ncbi:TPA: glycosyltransferase, partial [Campylobacter lari]|nr:glycosyltransferase [Campylobacter lari]